MSQIDKAARKAVLLKAIDVGNITEVRQILTDDDIHMNEGRTSLFHYICSPECELKGKRREMVELFLERGAEVNSKNSEEDAPLHLCVDSGDMECVEFLISKGAKVNDIGKHGTLTTTRAARNGNKQILECLFKHNAGPNHTDLKGRTVLHQIFCLPPLISADDTHEMVDVLLAHECDMNAPDEVHNRPLHYAAMCGCKAGVAYLTEKGAEVDAFNKDKQTALIKAAWRGELETMSVLIDAGAHINKIDGFCNSVINNACDTRAIFWDPITNDFENANDGCCTKEQKIVKENKEDCIKKLITEKKLEANFPNIIGMTPLMNASKGGLVSVVTALIEAKVDVVRRDINGRTALHHVYRENTNTDAEICAIVDELCQRKANVNQLDKFGNGPIHYAIMYTPRVDIELEKRLEETRSTEQTRLEYLREKRGAIFKLLENSADPNVIGRGGNSALHLACKYDTSEKFDCIRILRYFKADTNVVNNVGQTPVDIVRQSGKQDILDVITKTLDFNAPENKKDACCVIL